MAQDYRDCSLDHAYLLPQAPREWLPEGHLALFLEDAVGLLDLSEITRRYRKGRGPRAYHPRMLLTLLLYGYCPEVCSSRKIVGGCETDVAFRVLSGDSSPTSGPWPISSRTTWQPLRGSLLKCWGDPGSGIGGPLRNYLKLRFQISVNV